MQADYYAFDRLKTSLSFGGYASYRAVIAEAEWQPSQDTPFSLFADIGSAVATEHHGIVLVGLRYTFGAPGSSIKERDRHGDPQPLLQSGVASSNLMGNTTALQPTVTPTASAPAPI